MSPMSPGEGLHYVRGSLASRFSLYTFVYVRKLEAVERLEPMSEDHARRVGSCRGYASTLNTSDL